MLETVKFGAHRLQGSQLTLFLASRAPIEFAARDFLHTNGGAASGAGFSVVLVNVVSMLRPGFGFMDSRAVLSFGGDDAADTHADGEQMFVIFPESTQLIIGESFTGAKRIYFLAVKRFGTKNIAHA